MSAALLDAELWDDTAPAAAHPRGHAGRDEPDDAVAAFMQARPRLIEIARHVLGSVDDSEDVVQEAWLRWQRADRTSVVNPAAFLATTTHRLALNAVLSARRRHETYLDPERPEPADPAAADPQADAELSACATDAILLLLQRLSPLERAAYLLRESFDYPHQRIAEVLHISPVYTRQLVVRAHRAISTKPSGTVDPSTHRRLARAFLTAAQSGELRPLEELLAADAGARQCGAAPSARSHRGCRPRCAGMRGARRVDRAPSRERVPHHDARHPVRLRARGAVRRRGPWSER